MLVRKLHKPVLSVLQLLTKNQEPYQGLKVNKLVTRNMSAAAATYNFETLKVTRPKEFVVQVEVNRPEKRNAQNNTFYREIRECFQQLSHDVDCRAVVLTGAGKIFSAGIDFEELSSLFMNQGDADAGRKAVMIKNMAVSWQDGMSAIEKCPKPVIAAIHSACVGAGVDLVCTCDIRYVTQDAWFQIKEVDIGIAADLGTLQRLPKIVGNESLVRELAFTARKFDAEEAKSFGFVSRIFPDKDKMVDGAIEVANEIAEKSPIAVQGTKVNLVYARDHSVPEGLEYVVTWNSAMLQSEDVMKAAMAAMTKEKATFSKL